VLFTQYPWTWEGGTRSGGAPGGGNINSGEGRDLQLGACASEMSCVTCHDPHAPDNQRRMQALEGPEGSAICVRCHPKFAGAEAVRAHTHHEPAGAGGQCLSCHMPRKNMSLENGLSRYHRIGSPNDPVRVEHDRPIECALCHADRSVAQLVSTMESWGGRRYDRAALRQLYGDLDGNVMRETLKRGKAHEQASALAVLGQAKDREAVPLLAAQLTHPIPIVRYFAVRALEAVLGRTIELDLFQDNAAIRSAAAQLLGASGLTAPLTPAPAGAEPTAEE
jgi:predicted CXXCH cytochrome family protein